MLCGKVSSPDILNVEVGFRVPVDGFIQLRQQVRLNA
jgi:hypothetical protein